MTRLGAVAVRASGLRWLPLVVSWVLASAPNQLVYRLLVSLPIFHFRQSAFCSLDLPIRLMPTNALLNHSSPLPSTLKCATTGHHCFCCSPLPTTKCVLRPALRATSNMSCDLSCFRCAGRALVQRGHRMRPGAHNAALPQCRTVQDPITGLHSAGTLQRLVRQRDRTMDPAAISPNARLTLSLSLLPPAAPAQRHRRFDCLCHAGGRPQRPRLNVGAGCHVAPAKEREGAGQRRTA